MNPITEKILSDLDEPAITQFVRGWGQLEALIVDVYRSGETTRADIKEHRQLRRALQADYPTYADQLAAYWPEALIDGAKAQSDPFQTLLAVKNAKKFVQNWAIMQTLPAVRQALNEWLVDRLAESKKPPNAGAS